MPSDRSSAAGQGVSATGSRAATTLPDDLVLVADPHHFEPGVLIGYRPGRKPRSEALRIGPNSHIRTGTILYGGTVIGRDFETGHNVLVREDNVIGDQVSIWSNSVVDYGCTIGDRVKIHTNVYIPQFTVLEDDVFIGPGCTFANDMYPGCPTSYREMKGPLIGRATSVGVNVTILPAVRIGESCLIGSGSVVTKDIPPNSVAWGNPARVMKQVRELDCCDQPDECRLSQPHPSTD